MIKFVIGSEQLYKRIQSIPVVKKFFVFDVSALDEIKDFKLFDNIYSSISNPNGTSKTTSGNRFDDLDKCLLEALPSKKINAHDVAVSSGITSIALYDQLVKQDKVKSFHISDKYSELTYEGDGIKRFYDASGQCTFIHVFGLYAIKQTSWFFFLSKCFHAVFNKAQTTNSTKSIRLFHPLVKQKTNGEEWTVLDYDVFKRSHLATFDLVRCMNLLNTLQFSEEQITLAIENLKASLHEGGYLLLGRTTMKGEHRASLLQKSNDNWISIKEINGGSELKHLL